MKIQKWYSDDIQSIHIQTWWLTTHLMIEKETIRCWENWLIILWNFIENPMDYYVGMDYWREVFDKNLNTDITFNLWYTNKQRTIQVFVMWREMWLLFNKKEILYFAWVLKDCIENVRNKIK